MIYYVYAIVNKAINKVIYCFVSTDDLKSVKYQLKNDDTKNVFKNSPQDFNLVLVDSFESDNPDEIYINSIEDVDFTEIYDRKDEKNE